MTTDYNELTTRWFPTFSTFSFDMTPADSSLGL